MKSKYHGRFVAVKAKDHSSSMNLDEDDYQMVTGKIARVIASGFVVDENDDAIHLSSFFSEICGKTTHHEIHSILKKEIEEINLLTVTETIILPFA